MPAKRANAVAAVVAHAAATATTVASPGLPDGGIATSGPAVVAPTAVTATAGAPVTGAPVPREDPLTGGALVPVSGLLDGGADPHDPHSRRGTTGGTGG